MKKLFLFLLLPLSLAAQNKYAGPIHQFMRGQQDYFRFNGNVLVARDGKIVYQGALGYADYSTKRNLNDSTVFELASVSKQFTAMAILILKERGKLDISDKVKKYLPAIPYGDITIRQLLTHTSGLPSYESQFEKFWDHKKIAHNNDIIEMLKLRNDSLLFKPGTKWKYSNTGYALLAAIIEHVSGTSFNDFLAKNIFQPLGMTHSFVYNTRRSTNKIPSNYAMGYVYSDSIQQYLLPDSIPELDMVHFLDGIVGDGCVNSTTGDLLKWDRALYSDKLVSKATLDEMQSPLVRISPVDSTTYYGFGVMVQPNGSRGKVISHTGGWPGYATLLDRKIDTGETIIILSNNESLGGQLKSAIEAILAGDTLIMPYHHTEIKIDSNLLDRYVGKYTAFFTLQLVKANGKLFRRRMGNPDIELKPESDTKFFYSDGTDRQIEFEVDDKGTVKKAWFINAGLKGEMKKIE